MTVRRRRSIQRIAMVVSLMVLAGVGTALSTNNGESEVVDHDSPLYQHRTATALGSIDTVPMTSEYICGKSVTGGECPIGSPDQSSAALPSFWVPCPTVPIWSCLLPTCDQYTCEATADCSETECAGTCYYTCYITCQGNTCWGSCLETCASCEPPCPMFADPLEMAW